MCALSNYLNIFVETITLSLKIPDIFVETITLSLKVPDAPITSNSTYISFQSNRTTYI